VTSSTISGNVTVTRAEAVGLRSNTVYGSLRVDSSRAVTLEKNRVWGNLACAKNSPAPRGTGNKVTGTKSG